MQDGRGLLAGRQILCAFKLGGGPEETCQSITWGRGGVETSVRNVKGSSAMLGAPGLMLQLCSIDAAAAPGRAAPLVRRDSSLMLETMGADRVAQSRTDLKPLASVIKHFGWFEIVI